MFRQIRRLSGGGLIPFRILPAEYSERRSRLDQLIVKSFPNKEYVVLVRGAETSFTAPDVPHVFRQCSHFTYLTGVRVPGCSYLVHKTAGGRTRRILFMERRSEYQQLWEGPLPKDEELEKTAGFDELLSPKELQQVLSKMASPQSNFFFQDARWKNTEIHPIRSEFASSHNVVEYIEKLRVVKSTTEVEAMRDVCGIGAQMMNSAMATSRGYVSENAVVGLLEFEARRRGAEGLAYPPVVAAGNRANTIHYLDANKSMEMGECLLVDAGCDLNGYVSDITRCWPISGEWSPVQRNVYEHLRLAHVQLLDFANSTEKLRLSSIYRQMIDLLAVCMTEAGVIPKTASDGEKIAMAEKLCPHHVSHYLGMDVHDCASVSREIDLLPGVAFTIEPGVYIPHDSSFPKQFRGIGFRIEDDVVTRPEGGIEILTDAVPRTAHEIEYMMNPM